MTAVGGVATLTEKGARWVRTGHPWIYRDDLASVEAGPGELVAVRHPRGGILGWGVHADRSKIAVRFLTREPGRPDLDRLLANRFEEAARAREATVRGTSAYRVVSSEGDGLPGLIVDRYADVFVFQTSSQGAERWRDAVVDWIERRFSPRAIVERNDGAVRDLEGLPRRSGRVRGALPDETLVDEHGVRYTVDPLAGQKTGSFLDQRENRLRVREHARGMVLDAFAYEGLFGLHALAGGAERVVAVESSARAEAAARAQYARNDAGDRLEWVRANAFDFLRRQEGAGFDLVVLDPPAFAKSRAEVPAALRGYREINLRAMLAVRSGGVVVSCSCSSNVRPEAFLEVVREAAADSRRRVILLGLFGQSSDHPVLVTLPESRYLKAAFLKVF